MPQATSPQISPEINKLFGSQRKWLYFAPIAAAIAVGAAIAPWTFSSKALLEEVALQIQTSSGLFVAAQGRSTFSVLPRPHITIERIAFADPLAALTIQADRLYGALNVLRLLTGRLELSTVTLTHPDIAIDLDRKPMSAAGAAAVAAALPPSSPQAQKADQAPLGAVSIVDGRARVRHGSGKEEIVEKIDANLDWRTVGAPATLTAAFSWRGERPHALLWIARPSALLRCELTPATIRLDSAAIRLEAEGMGQACATPRFVGRISGSSPSLRQALSLFDLSVPLPGPFEQIQLSGQASVAAHELQLTGASFLADGNEFQGSILLRAEGDRPLFQASLFSNFVSLRPITGDLPPFVGADGQWSREVLNLPDLNGADVDLRLSAAHARLARLNLSDAALSLALRMGRLEIALSDAKAYKGALKARATLAANASSGTVEFHANAQTVGIDAGTLLWDAAAREDLSGSLDMSATLDARGESIAQLMRDLDGRATFVLTQGELAGINLERALRRLDKRPLSSAIDIHSGRSTVDRATATIRIDKGTAIVDEGMARGPGFSLVFSGSTRIPDRSLAIKAQAFEADNLGKPREKGLQIGFDLSGFWEEPSFAPDAQALIKRSGAAAPLLPRTESQPPQGPADAN
jgi:AsmA protein